MFAHLQAHSHFTFHAGTLSPEALVDGAAARGHPAVALTDRNATHGLVPFYQAALRAGIRPLLGVELDQPAPTPSTPDPDAPRRALLSTRPRAVVLARDRQGYTQLCAWTSRRQLDPAFDLTETLAARTERLWVLADPGLLRTLVRLSGPAGLLAALRDTGTPTSRARRERDLASAAALGVPAVAVDDVYLASPADLPLHRTLRAIGLTTTVTRVPPAELAGPTQSLDPPIPIEARFADRPDLLGRTVDIAGSCHVDLELGRWVLPAIQLPAGETAESLLHRLATAGFRERFPDLPGEAESRLTRELTTINRMGFAPYFLCVWDLVRQAHRMGIGTLGRGSAASSLVAYCLRLTHIDPLSYGLVFERFLNPARIEPPDVDIDVDWRRRDELIRAIYRTHGDERVAMLSTVNCYRTRGAVRDAARARGLPPDEIARLTRRLSSFGHDRLTDDIRARPQLADLELTHLADVLDDARALHGIPRHTSIHCAGVVIAPRPLTEYCGLERATKGLVVTQPDMHGIEALGLVKIDILGNRSLGVLPRTLELLARRGEHPDVSDHEALAADPPTRAMIRAGGTIGCFYMESPAMRQLLRQLDVEGFAQFVAANSVIRPGVARSGMRDSYIARTRDPLLAREGPPCLREVLAATHGVMIFQEDVLRVAHQLGGLTMAEADLLRRAMKRRSGPGGHTSAALGQLERRFVAGCRLRGLDDDAIAEIWRRIASFAGYAFCKAHSAAFSRLSFQVAYLKAHYPAEFLAAVLDNGGGYYGPRAYLSEARRLGAELRPPDVNAGEEGWAGGPGWVRAGLSAIRGLAASDRRSIVAGAPYADLRDLAARSGLGPAALRALVRVGACDAFGLSRPRLLWLLDMLGTHRAGRGSCRDRSGHLFGEPLAPPDLPDWDTLQRCRAEHELLGQTLTRHPLELLDAPPPPDVLPADRLSQQRPGARVRMLGWTLATREMATRGGKMMKFLALEDTSGPFTATVYPDTFRRIAHRTYAPGFLLEGRVEEVSGVATLTVTRLQPLTTRL